MKILLLKTWDMKFTEFMNIWYISVRITSTIKLNIKTNLKWKLGFCTNVYVANGLQPQNNRGIA